MVWTLILSVTHTEESKWCSALSQMVALTTLGRRLALAERVFTWAPALNCTFGRVPVRSPVTKAFSLTTPRSSKDSEIYARTGVDPSIYTARKVVIFRPAPNRAQNGPYAPDYWRLQYVFRPTILAVEAAMLTPRH
jgi:hypothetical protein